MKDKTFALPGRTTLERWDDTYNWHPFTPQSVYREEAPLMFVEGEGNYLIDVDGQRYLDGVASIWCNALGHGHPEITKAVHTQLDTLAHATFLGNATPLAVMLARELALLAPKGLQRVFFSDNGSTATEIALKMAYQYWSQTEGGERKRKILALTHAYSGDTIGAVSVGGIDLFHRKFRDLIFETIRAPSPYCYRCPLDTTPERCGTACLEQTLRLIEENAHELAAVIMEPGMQGAGGIIVYPEGFLRRVREVTQRCNVLLILDEVAVGMGRSGHMFACEKEGVSPDFLCLAKMLTNGYLPLAATLTTEKVYRAFLGSPEEAKTFYHGHTFTGNPLGAAAALATLEAYKRQKVLQNLGPLIAHLHREVQRLQDHRHLGDIRCFGFCVGLELVADRSSKTPFEPEQRRAYNICRHAREKGVFLGPLGDILVLMPPLSVTRDEITLLVDALAYGLEQEFGNNP